MRWSLPLLLVLAACKGKDDGADVDTTVDPIEVYDPVAWVDPTIGTGGPSAAVGSINPGAVLPWGMVQAGPATRASFEAPFYHCAGYYYEDTAITGFGHTFAHGMGVTEMGGILVMPKNGWEDGFTKTRGRLSAFDHTTEWASPGYYAVDLLDDGIHAELTATRRGAVHRYTFEEGTAEPVVLFDLGYVNSNADTVSDAWIDVDLATGQVQGFQRLNGGYSNRFGGLMQHFEGAFDPAPISVGSWVDNAVPEADIASAAATADVDNPHVNVGAWLVFPAGTTEVQFRIGVSYVDSAGAANNLASENPDFDFDGVRDAAESEWREQLDNVRVRSMHEAGSDAEARDMSIFHTAQYHAMQMPRTYQDVDGRYRGFDQQIHDGPGHPVYSDFSGWDTFRTQHPWLTLVRPETQRDMNKSLLLMVEDGGSLPRWPLAHGYTSGMIGTPMVQVMAGSYLKGVTDWDVEAGFDAAWSQSTEGHNNAGRSGVDHYVNSGYVPIESSGSAAAHTLEYAWSDGSLALWADELGRPEAAQAHDMAGNWANTWDAESGFFWSRSQDGSFPNIEDPLGWSGNFVEGSAWHYVWMVPTDPMGMIDLQHGGDVDAFLTRYDDFWARTYIEQLDEDRIAGLPGLHYWHGNEPDIHYPFLGSMVGHRDHSAEPVRFVLEHKYDNAGWGIDGNDDGGTLSAWYLFGSIGFFPVAGTPTYALGSPIFERAEIDVNGQTLVMRAPGASVDAMYITDATLGGEPLDGGTFEHDQLIDGSELVLQMGVAPAPAE